MNTDERVGVLERHFPASGDAVHGRDKAIEYLG
jgi:hypothetical protein